MSVLDLIKQSETGLKWKELQGKCVSNDIFRWKPELRRLINEGYVRADLAITGTRYKATPKAFGK